TERALTCTGGRAVSNAQAQDTGEFGDRIAREEALLHALLDTIPDGLYLKDTESRFLLANRAIARILALDDPSRLIGKTDHDFYPAEVADRFRAEERAVMEQGERFVDRVAPTMVDGMERWYSVTKIPVVGASGRVVGLAGISRDITEHRKGQEDLQNERNLLRTLVDMLPHSIYMKDLECRKTMANPVDLKILGATTEAEVLGKTDYDIYPDEIAAPFYRDDLTVLESGTPVIDREEYYLAKDGTKRWILTSKMPLRDAQGRIIGLVGVGRDITSLKEREAKIREQAQLLDIAADAIMVRDESNRILYWNRSAERTFGWSAAEAIGKDQDALLHGRRPQETRDAIAAVKEKGIWVGDLHYATKGGTEILGEARWTLVRDEAANRFAVLCVSTDVTERRAVQAQLLRAQRMESLGTLAGGIAHDLNNVLTPIVAGLDLIGESITNEESRQLLATIAKSARRGAAVVKQVLSFARGIEGESREVRLVSVLDEIADIIRETFPRSIELVVETPSDLWTVMGSQTQLHQVVMNLCVNARDAMPDGGNLSLTTANVRLDEAYVRTHLDAKPIAYVVIDVVDTGTGMTPEVVDRIFEPFFTTKDPGTGTGRGLSTTLSIVTGHGGVIHVYSEPGRGSSFKVYIPAATQAAPTTAKEDLPDVPRGAGELVLVVDDEEAVRETTRWALEGHGYRVVTVADGAEAVATYVERRAEIACVITDMMMPHMDGAATIRTIRRLDPRTRVIAMSGLPTSGFLAEARALDVQAFLAKLFETAHLLRTLADVLLRS
ncbi:MAG TPA: PAS domain-containing protein, partial [Spirochaetia bacterium]